MCACKIQCELYSVHLKFPVQNSKGFMSIWGGSRPVVDKKTGNVSEGIYLDDLASMEDPEMARIYLGRPRYV